MIKISTTIKSHWKIFNGRKGNGLLNKLSQLKLEYKIKGKTEKRNQVLFSIITKLKFS